MAAASVAAACVCIAMAAAKNVMRYGRWIFGAHTDNLYMEQAINHELNEKKKEREKKK